MTNLCIITGATTFGLLFGYLTLRLHCWMDGREW